MIKEKRWGIPSANSKFFVATELEVQRFVLSFITTKKTIITCTIWFFKYPVWKIKKKLITNL